MNHLDKCMSDKICKDCKKNPAQIHGYCVECCPCCSDSDRVDMFGDPVKNRELPMGVSQWKEHGKKYGYWKFFKKKIAWGCKTCNKIDWVDVKEPLAKPEHIPHRGFDIGKCKGKMVSLYEK